MKKVVLLFIYLFLSDIVFAVWNIETVPDTDRNCGMYSSLKIDTNGYPQISYYSGSFTGEYSSIAIDSLNNPHISYYDWTFSSLKYYNGATQSIQTVDATNGVGMYSSLKLDSSNNPKIAYYDTIYGDLRYASYNGSSWSYQIVDSSGDVGQYASLALHPSNQYPRIAYYDWTNMRLKYASWNGTSWDISVVDSSSTADLGEYCSLALDSSGNPAISYLDATNGILKFAKYNSVTSKWDIEIVDSGTGGGGGGGGGGGYAYVGYYSSLVIDTNGNPHISYYDYTTRKLKYATKTGLTWTIMIPDLGTTNDVGGYTSITINNTGKPIISYYDWTSSDLKCAQYVSGTTWQVWKVDYLDDVGQYTSVALDSNQNIYISYLDITNFDLKLAKYTGGSWQTVIIDGGPGDLKFATKTGTGWTIQTIDSQGDKGLYTSIDIDTQNIAHIGYMDYTSIDTNYATGSSGSGWTTSVVQSAGNVGQYTSIALDSNGNPHMSYYDYSNNDLIYAYKNGAQWVYQIVDSSGDVGSYTSIALDTNNQPHISYYDWTNGDLKYAKWTGSGWIYTVVDSSGDVGLYTSIALDTNNQPHISYYDWTNGDLKYAKWTGSAWQIKTIDSVGDVGWDTSILLDNNDNPSIAYYDWTNGDLKYAKWTGSAWQIETVDSSGDVGQFCSLSRNAYGDPRISYFDLTNGKLKYAYFTPQTVSIKGYIRDTNGIGIDAVTVSLTGDQVLTTYTNSTGYYEFLNITANRNYTVTPTKSGYTFNPVNRNYYPITSDQIDQNFTGTVATVTYFIKGYVLDISSSGVSNVRVTLSGANSGDYITGATGYYEFSGLAAGNYTVTPTKSGCTFTPVNRTYSPLSSDQNNQNFTLNVPVTYYIKGYIKDANSVGIGSVIVNLSGTNSGIYTTSSSGYYEFINLVSGAYTVTPTKSGYTFNPVSRTYSLLNANQDDQNFIGTYIGSGPILKYNPTALDFGYLDPGQSRTLTFNITNQGTGTLTGTVSTDRSWIKLTPTNFSGNSTVINVTVDNSILNKASGQYTGIVNINSNGGSGKIDIVVKATCVLVKPNPADFKIIDKLTFFGNGIVPGKTTIKIYTISGQLVKVISVPKLNQNGENIEDGNELTWDGKNEDGEPVTSGIYLYIYESPTEKGIGKFTIIRDQ